LGSLFLKRTVFYSLLNIALVLELGRAIEINKKRGTGRLTEFRTANGFLVELLSGAVWMIVFATSKGKTADQNWIASE
jgi:hypothetical protein